MYDVNSIMIIMHPYFIYIISVKKTKSSFGFKRRFHCNMRTVAVDFTKRFSQQVIARLDSGWDPSAMSTPIFFRTTWNPSIFFKHHEPGKLRKIPFF